MTTPSITPLVEQVSSLTLEKCTASKDKDYVVESWEELADDNCDKHDDKITVVKNIPEKTKNEIKTNKKQKGKQVTGKSNIDSGKKESTKNNKSNNKKTSSDVTTSVSKTSTSISTTTSISCRTDTVLVENVSCNLPSKNGNEPLSVSESDWIWGPVNENPDVKSADTLSSQMASSESLPVESIKNNDNDCISKNTTPKKKKKKSKISESNDNSLNRINFLDKLAGIINWKSLDDIGTTNASITCVPDVCVSSNNNVNDNIDNSKAISHVNDSSLQGNM